MNLLLIGDMHVRKENIEESEKVIDWINNLKKQFNAKPVFMGDQHDTMSIVRTEVIDFWDRAYKKIGINQSYSIEGNHDLCSTGKTSAMTAHNQVTKVITKLENNFITTKVGAIGYVRDNNSFIERSLELYREGVRYILCHAEFYGAKYENGFYAPHGINLDELPEDLYFISGHIHKKQEIVNVKNGKPAVFYVGTPRMLTKSDIGENKGVTVFNTETFTFLFMPTPEDVAEPLVSYTIKEGDELPEIKNSSKVFVDITGSNDFVKEMCKKMPTSVKVRTIIKDPVKEILIKESDGISVAFLRFVNSSIKDKVNSEDLNLILEGIYEKCPKLKSSL